MYGERLRFLRLERHITQRDLAKDLNISFSNLGMIEREERGLTSENLKMFANYYGVSADWILGETNDRYRSETITNPLKEEFNNVISDLNDDELKDVISYISFLKSKRKQ